MTRFHFKFEEDGLDIFLLKDLNKTLNTITITSRPKIMKVRMGLDLGSIWGIFPTFTWEVQPSEEKMRMRVFQEWGWMKKKNVRTHPQIPCILPR